MIMVCNYICATNSIETRRLMKKATRQKYWRAKMERTFQLPTTNTALVDGSITTTTTISPAAVAVNRIGRRNKFAHEKEYIRAANPLNAKWILQSNWATVLALLTNFWSEANVCVHCIFTFNMC